jgi:PAS domain S-box-containing protein
VKAVGGVLVLVLAGAVFRSLPRVWRERAGERTAELEAANARLRAEAAQRLEAEVQRLNQLLRSRVDELESLLEVLPVGVGIARGADCLDIRMNEALTRMLGLEAAGNAAMAAADSAVAGRFRVLHEGRELAPSELPMQRCVAENRPLQAFPLTLEGADGELLEWLCNAVPVRDPEGGVRGCIATFQDVSYLREALRANARYAAIVASSADAVIGGTTEGVVTDWNHAAERIFGYGAEEMLGQAWRRLVPEARHGEEEARLARVARGETLPPFETERVRKDGRVVEVSVVISPIRDASGAVVGCSEVVRDIGERRQAERRQQELDRKIQESQKLESLGVLAGGIAHDFNNLLTGILGNASFALRMLPAGAPCAAQLADIEKAAGRAAELCAQMLAYARRGRVVARPVGLNPLIEETTHLIGASLGPGVKVDLALAPELPAVMADPTQLRQIVMNLVMNAAEAIGEGSGTVSLRTGLREVGVADLAAMRTGAETKPGRYVFLEVRDTGRGMEAEVLGRIFEPFFTTKFTGRGLGLAAVLGIVRGHQGGLRVESVPGRGSVFELVLPPAPELAGEVASGPAGAGERAGTAVAPGAVGPVRDGVREAAGGRSRGRVLVVDDEEAVRHVATRLLEHMGFAVEAAVDGREALGRLALDPGRYALVLLDLTMPRLDGAETWRQLRRIRPDLRVVLISGFDQPEVMRRFAGEGLAGFIAKPFEPASFQAAIRAALGG